jgi:RNA polymerase sigma-70 factor (ECF subfamily)
MEPDESFIQLEERLRNGDQGAATEVFRRFANRLIALAGKELDSRIQRKEDPEDVVQSVYRSFFTRHRNGQFDLANWDSLWSLLTVITVRKCRNRARHYGAERRKISGEIDVASWEDSAAGFGEAIDREPTPLEATILAETVEEMMRGLKPDERQIIELSLQEYTIREISARLGRAERTVQRVRDHIKKRLQRLQAVEPHET